MKNTTTALLQISDTIYQSTDENNITAAMTIDQSSAFDCVDHSILLEKLKMYNVGQGMINWLTSYLDNRSKYVAIGNSK